MMMEFVAEILDLSQDMESTLFFPHEQEHFRQLIGLFENWESRLTDFPPRLQNRIIWRIIGNPLFIGRSFESVEVPMKTCIAMLRSMANVTLAIPNLHPKDDPMENGYFMWWDCVCDDLKHPTLTGEALDILSRLLEHSDDRVVAAALHGLGHLDHPDRYAVVQRFIDKMPPGDATEWLCECRDGTVM